MVSMYETVICTGDITKTLIAATASRSIQQERCGCHFGEDEIAGYDGSNCWKLSRHCGLAVPAGLAGLSEAGLHEGLQRGRDDGPGDGDTGFEITVLSDPNLTDTGPDLQITHSWLNRVIPGKSRGHYQGDQYDRFCSRGLEAAGRRISGCADPIFIRMTVIFS